jgi:hypothetical protein
MNKGGIILGSFLIIMNAGCHPQADDLAITLAYKEQQVYELEETRKQLMAILPIMSKDLSREEVIEIAKQSTDEELFDKDDCVWVGRVGLKFDETGKLAHVSPTWNYGEKDPCFPR